MTEANPPFENRVRIDFVRVRMRDGVELCAKISRPDAAGPFPAVMEYNPYRRLKRLHDDYREEYPPIVPYLAEHGYAVVQFDARGTGNSGGYTTDIYNEQEQADGVEMIAWIADQAWCTGRVGMFGKSFSAVVQWQIAVQNPPALKAIIVRSANDDVYTEWVYPGGCLRPYMFDSYSANMNTWNFAPPDPDVVGDDWESLWHQHLADNQPWGIGYIRHQLQGSYWRDRSLATDYSRVKCAAFVVSGWSDCYSTALTRAYENLSCPKKALVGPWGHWYGEEKMTVPGPRIDTRPIYRRWFDHWLKEIDTGIMDEPSVTVFVRRFSPLDPRMPLVEPGSWRNEISWPIARRIETPFYLHRVNLIPEPPAAAELHELPMQATTGIASGIHWGGGVLPWGMPVDQRLDEPNSLCFTSEVLSEDVEVTGTPFARLHVSSNAREAYFRVKLVDVAPDGTAKQVRYGGLNATHRNSHESPEWLQPGQVYEIEVPIKAVSYTFAAGHRIRVMVASADFQNAWPTREAGIHTVHCSAEHPSCVVLPVIPAQNPPLPDPALVELPPADPRVLLQPTEYSVKQNHSHETATARLHVHSGDPDNRLELFSDFTVSDPDPATAVIQAYGRFRMKRQAFDVEVHSDEELRSDASQFHHRVKINITRDGESYFEKEWRVSVPRE